MPSGTGGNTTNFPYGFSYGVNIRGVPLLQAQPGIVFWLDNGPSMNPNQHAGSDSSHGTFNDPFASLNYAFSQCLPGRGDIIMVGAGHKETISAATALNLNCSDVAVIGLGGGTNRPQWTFDTLIGSTINVTGANISFQNCQFIANFAAITSLVTFANASVTASITGNVMNVTVVGGGTLYPGNMLAGTGVTVGTMIISQLTGTPGGVGTYQVSAVQTVASTTVTTSTPFFTMDACEIRDTSAILNFLALYTTTATANAADGWALTRNRIMLKATTGAVRMVTSAGTADRCVINDNDYIAQTTGTGALVVCGATSLTNLEFFRNHISIQGTTAGATVLITSSSGVNTGMISENTMHGLTQTPVLATASSGFTYGSNNLWADTADLQGYLVPAADS